MPHIRGNEAAPVELMSKSYPAILGKMWYNITREVRFLEDKMFELMEKLYGELSSFRNETHKRFDTMDKKFDTMDKRFDSLESDVKGVKKDILRIENDLKPKVETALDGYKAVYEKLQ